MKNKNNKSFHCIRILIVEDHSITRAAIKAILCQQAEFLVIGEASTGKEGVELAKKLKPDVILLDIDLPDISGIQVAKRILQHLPVKIIALTSQTDQIYLNQLSKLGISGYLTKTCAPKELFDAIIHMKKNLLYITPQVAEEVSLSFITQKKESPFKSLTQRELEILIMICHGEKTAHIAEKLFLSPKTINKHRRAFLKKVNVQNVIELAKLAVQHGVIRL